MAYPASIGIQGTLCLDIYVLTSRNPVSRHHHHPSVAMLLRTTTMALCTAINSLRDGYAFYRRRLERTNGRTTNRSPIPLPSVCQKLKCGRKRLRLAEPHLSILLSGSISGSGSMNGLNSSLPPPKTVWSSLLLARATDYCQLYWLSDTFKYAHQQ